MSVHQLGSVGDAFARIVRTWIRGGKPQFSARDLANELRRRRPDLAQADLESAAVLYLGCRFGFHDDVAVLRPDVTGRHHGSERPD